MSFKMSLTEYIQQFFFPCQDNALKLKTKRFRKGITAFMEKLDISYILNKFYEIDKLKMLLLDQDQYHLFEYLPKPVILKNATIDLGKKDSAFISYETQKDVVEKAKKILEGFKNIKKKPEMSAMDIRLIELLDDNVKMMLEVYFFF